MFAVSYRNTESSIRRIKAAKDEERRLSETADRRCSLEVKIAELSRELADISEPVVIRSEYQRIEARACRVFRVKPLDLKSARRHKRIVMARFFIMYWAYRKTLLSSTQIGRLLGGKDHTSILHGKDQYPKRRAKMGRILPEAR